MARYPRFRGKRRQVHSRGIGRVCPGGGGDIPDVAFFVVIRTILVELADSGSHVEEARVEEHEHITRHAGADRGIVVMSSCPPVVRGTPFLGDYDEDTHNTVQVLTLEDANFGAILPLLP